MGKGLRVVHLNIRSLYKNYDELFILFKEYDIILLSETWLNSSIQSAVLEKNGFSLFRLDRGFKINKKGGGLAIYVRSDIAVYTSVCEEACDITRELEQFWLHVQEPGKKFFVLGVIYRPPAGSIKMFCEQIKVGLKNAYVKPCWEHLVMGDFNIDFSHEESNACKELKDIMCDYNLKHIRTDYTRITEKSKSILDLIFSDMQHVVETGVKPYIISDHLPIYIVRKKRRNIIEKEKVEFRQYKNYDITKLGNLIKNDTRWVKFWEENVSVDALWEIMYNVFIEAIDRLCPMVEKMVQLNRPDWVTEQVTTAIREKNMLYNRAQLSGLNEDWTDFRNKKKTTAKLIKETKCSSIRGRLHENRGNPKKFWRQINEELLGKKKDVGIEIIRDANGNLISGSNAAEFINEFYSKTGKNERDGSAEWDETWMNMDRIYSDFTFQFIELLEVHLLIKNIDINKSSGVKGINARLLKDCLSICEVELAYLYNVSLHSMKFPDAWKNSMITPIPKSGDKLNVDNWRPINNLCVRGKLLEKCVYRQMEEYLEKNMLLCVQQHGFRKGRGTDTAVMELLRKLFTDINDNLTSSALFLDYSRAFNTVDHTILIRKMKYYGFSEMVCSWFENYFKDRKQYTRIGSVTSPGVRIEHGVNQGSPLGPLLFILYINDIVNVTGEAFCNIYADDTVLICSGSNINILIDQTEAVFRRVNDWCRVNNISVNSKKTKHMLSGAVKKGDMENLSREAFDGDICRVENFTYLGVNIDAKLNFEKFINGTVSKVNGRLLSLARIRNMMDMSTSLLIYKQTILPIIDYLSIIVNSSTKRKIKKLQPLQNRAIRTILKLSGYISTENMDDHHERLHLVLLENRRKYFMLKMMYKLSRIESNIDHFRPDRVLRTAPKVKMKIEFTDKERVCKSPFYLCNRLWDKLEADIQLLQNPFIFSNVIKKLGLSAL